ncbi:beta-lactamase hydrolase domain-containing protein [Amylibacter sp. SFDW26]|uniref:beta-lactamase hydrolase domain-containing protein n=1 Tax=Amylibacter sp. SFDW26 TaxID=2652722 RepID=UPI00186A5405|nr:sulfur transferase domain-containing protein [Amylibacter sp. SFDW26]
MSVNIKKIDNDFSIADQVNATDIALISAMGFRSIVCVRPDGEDKAQELFEIVANSATISGVEPIYLPVHELEPTQKHVNVFARLFPKMARPILAYSKTGERAKALYVAYCNNAFSAG